ncbi:MAG: ribonuclease H-like domain-containing protein [Epulopiscium sp.]|nr:ribonuclease H-like domain-containing protein [Candidatus Epulonipiscium sp.]
METTGFSAEHSKVFLIGCAYFKNNHWILNQFFAENPDEENDVIDGFFKLASSFSHIIHFNGDTFDIPYLEKKARIAKIPNPLKNMKTIDILKYIRPYKNTLNLDNCRLKTIERFLNINRKDIYDGRELISQYKRYCHSPKDNLLNNLLTHNEEDIYGLLKILRIYDIMEYIKKLSTVSFYNDIVSINLKNKALLFSLKVLKPSPLSHIIKDKGWHCSLTSKSPVIDFNVHTFRGTLYHFFPNYKEYYYLPEQDEAVHKSLGSIIPREKREPAKRSTCYIKKTGLFLPIISDNIGLPVFMDSYDSDKKYIYIEYDLIQNNKTKLIHLGTHFIDFMTN